MALQEIIEQDESFQIQGYSQLDMLILLKEYINASPFKIEKQHQLKFPFNPDSQYVENQIYSYYVLGDIMSLKKGSPDQDTIKLVLNGKAEFIIDEEKFIIRPIHLGDDDSKTDRDIIYKNFLEYLSQKNITVFDYKKSN